jgi:hypothetical protein
LLAFEKFSLSDGKKDYRILINTLQVHHPLYAIVSILDCKQGDGVETGIKLVCSFLVNYFAARVLSGWSLIRLDNYWMQSISVMDCRQKMPEVRSKLQSLENIAFSTRK